MFGPARQRAEHAQSCHPRSAIHHPVMKNKTCSLALQQPTPSHLPIFSCSSSGVRLSDTVCFLLLLLWLPPLLSARCSLIYQPKTWRLTQVGVSSAVVPVVGVDGTWPVALVEVGGGGGSDRWQCQFISTPQESVQRQK